MSPKYLSSALVWGVILVRVFYEKNILSSSKWDYKGYNFQKVKGYQRWPFLISKKVG
jgi:hypothetical protein